MSSLSSASTCTDKAYIYPHDPYYCLWPDQSEVWMHVNFLHTLCTCIMEKLKFTAFNEETLYRNAIRWSIISIQT